MRDEEMPIPCDANSEREFECVGCCKRFLISEMSRMENACGDCYKSGIRTLREYVITHGSRNAIEAFNAAYELEMPDVTTENELNALAELNELTDALDANFKAGTFYAQLWKHIYENGGDW